MSTKTLRPLKKPAFRLTTQRFALRRTQLLACAVGLIMSAPATTFALELGEATMKSGIGQTMLVHIPYRLATNEGLTPACIALRPAAGGDSAFPTYTSASRIAITPTHIEIFGDSRVLEPLIGLTVDVHCNTAPRFVRSYELFVDLPSQAPTTLVANTPRPATTSQPRVESTSVAPATAAAATVETPAPRANGSARARGQIGDTLAQGQTYVVVRGDTLSGIAARVGDRPATIRDAADAIFAANTEAFARGNPDLLQAGRTITIPLMTPAAATPAALLPAVREVEPPAAAPLPVADTPAAAASEAPAVTEVAPRPSVPATLMPIPAPISAAPPRPAQPSAAPEATPAEARSDATNAAAADAPSETASAPATGRASMWLTALLALGAVIALSAPLLFMRRRRSEEPAPPVRDVKRRAAHPRRLVDPVAGIDVVEEQLPRAPSSSTAPSTPPSRTGAAPHAAPAVAAESHAFALDIGPTDTVDIDVGVPFVADPRVQSVGDSAVQAALADAADATLERPSSAIQAPEPIDDEQHTLTVFELDMLRQDWETEHTLTHASNKALRDAVADLKATQAALAAGAASAEVATLKMPQQAEAEDEPTTTQRTQRLRSSR